MNLDAYLSLPDALSVSELRERVGVKNDVQIRQWRHGYAGRQPSPECAVAIEVATDRKVMRWDLRPNDWHRIWPELVGVVGAPAATTKDSASSPCADEGVAAERAAAAACSRRSGGDRRMAAPTDDYAPKPAFGDRRSTERRHSERGGQ